MYNGKYAKNPAKWYRFSKRFTIMSLSLLLLMTLVIGGTLAYLSSNTSAVENTFTPVPVTCEVSEEFTDGINKKNVTAKNTSDVDVWLRMKLISYRVNENGQRIGGAATISPFTLEKGWIEKDGIYYYTAPVAPGASPAVPLIGESGIALQSYNDTDGGVQVIEVMAEAIQARGVDENNRPAVETVWPVKVNDAGTLSLNTSSGQSE